MICRICNGKSTALFREKILGKYLIQYYYCEYCNYIFTEESYWLEEAYAKPINISDTGILDRNLTSMKLVSVLVFFFFDKNAKYLDYAGGYGIFTRLMRDVGFDFYWSDNFCENILAQGFEFDSGLNTDIKLITALEVFEHFSNPIIEIQKMLSISKNIVFTTEILPKNIVQTTDWDYLGFEHGQHISFYSLKSLRIIADKFGLYFYSYGNIHLFTSQKLNEFFFKWLLFLSKRGLFRFIKKAMTSKTFNDHLSLQIK